MNQINCQPLRLDTSQTFYSNIIDLIEKTAIREERLREIDKEIDCDKTRSVKNIIYARINEMVSNQQTCLIMTELDGERSKAMHSRSMR